MHSLTIKESASGPRSLSQPSLSIIGLVATATAAPGAAQDALDTAFPLGKLTLVTNIDAAIAAAGNGGTLRRSLEAINDQASPIIVVARVAVGADADATEENVIAGINLLTTARNAVGVAPRILGVPGGLDTQPVTEALAVAARKLRAFVYARAIGDTVADALLYRRQFSARELMLIWPDSSDEFAGDIIARALGLRAQIDERIGWHKTISNVVLGGSTKVTRPVDFDLLDPSTTAGALNAEEITTIVNMNGRRLWGNRTTAGPDQPEFAFESAVRTSHALQDIIASAVQPFFDHPMTVALIKDLLETINAEFRALAVQGKVMGAKAFFDADANSSEQLAAGRPTFRIQYTPVAPLEDPTVNLVITDFYYAGFADQLT